MGNDNKIFVYDLPIIKTQKFKVRIPNKGEMIVERKEITRQQHNMGCTDGMKEGEVETRIVYEVIQKVDRDTWETAVSAVRRELKKLKSKEEK